MTAPRTAFIAYPGSGSTYIRLMLEIATGQDTVMGEDGDEGCLLSFTHHTTLDSNDPAYTAQTTPISPYYRYHNLVYYRGRGILLIRNPFLAVISFFRHQKFGHHSQSDFSNTVHKTRAREDLQVFYTAEFGDFARGNIVRWRQIVEDWVHLGSPLVVHSSSMTRDPSSSLGEVMAFLGLQPDPWRMECLHFSNVDYFKRKGGRLASSPYGPELEALFWREIHRVDRILRRFNHPPLPLEEYKRTF